MTLTETLKKLDKLGMLFYVMAHEEWNFQALIEKADDSENIPIEDFNRFISDIYPAFREDQLENIGYRVFNVPSNVAYWLEYPNEADLESEGENNPFAAKWIGKTFRALSNLASYGFIYETTECIPDYLEGIINHEYLEPEDSHNIIDTYAPCMKLIFKAPTGGKKPRGWKTLENLYTRKAKYFEKLSKDE